MPPFLFAFPNLLRRASRKRDQPTREQQEAAPQFNFRSMRNQVRTALRRRYKRVRGPITWRGCSADGAGFDKVADTCVDQKLQAFEAHKTQLARARLAPFGVNFTANSRVAIEKNLKTARHKILQAE